MGQPPPPLAHLLGQHGPHPHRERPEHPRLLHQPPQPPQQSLAREVRIRHHAYARRFHWHEDEARHGPRHDRRHQEGEHPRPPPGRRQSQLPERQDHEGLRDLVHAELERPLDAVSHEGRPDTGDERRRPLLPDDRRRRGEDRAVLVRIRLHPRLDHVDGGRDAVGYRRARAAGDEVPVVYRRGDGRRGGGRRDVGEQGQVGEKGAEAGGSHSAAPGVAGLLFGGHDDGRFVKYV